MKRLVPIALALAGLVVPSGSATAAADTCRGETATIVGSPGEELTGTNGRDVVVTNGAQSVSTSAGDDLVCVTGSTPNGKRVEVHTWEGDDVVTVSGDDPVRAVLGAGKDLFDGGPEVDTVKAGYIDAYEGEHVDQDRDQINTGAGDDSVRSGFFGLPNEDGIILGGGDDYAALEGSSGHVDGGTGVNSLFIETDYDPDATGSWSLDNIFGRLSKDDDPRFTWVGFERFYLSDIGYELPLYVFGGAADETFNSQGRGADAGPVVIDARAGDDVIEVNSRHQGALVGGRGSDTISIEAEPCCSRGSLRVDLDKDYFQRSDAKPGTRVYVGRFENVAVADFKKVFVLGDDQRNRLDATSVCQPNLRGRGGDDVLRVLESAWTSACALPVLDGSEGDDLLIGSKGADVLLGGPGRDEARGMAGRDRCVAEVRTGCERR